MRKALEFQKEVFEGGKYFLGVLWMLSSICYVINVTVKIINNVKAKKENN